ncbi:MAG: DUF4476 domain-containing protein [Bacteroidales bacterium]|jgi:hypothetical protein
MKYEVFTNTLKKLVVSLLNYKSIISKKSFLLLAFLLSISGIFAQKTNLIFFSEQGEKFSVVLNGVLQNANPVTNVKVTDLPAPSYKLKIIFRDSTLPQVDKNLMFHTGTETTFDIKKNNNGEYVVRYLNEVPIDQAPPDASGQSIVAFSMSGTSAPASSTTISTIQTTTTTGTANPGDVSMGVNVGGNGINVNINPGGVVTNGTTTTTYSTTTTTTTSSADLNPQVQPVQGQPAYVLPGYSGPVGCPYPMSRENFESLKKTISSKSFEESKLDIAKQVLTTNCLLSSQVREIMKLFSFEDSKLTFAKYAYGHTFDIGNYFKVNDAFSFESSIDELNKYISAYH